MHTTKFLIAALVLFAAIGGYVLGTRNKTTGAVEGNRAASLRAPALGHDGETADSRIPGAHHIHALTYTRDGALLLGTHGGLFKSADKGKTWEKVMTRGSVNADDWMSVVADPRERSILFAGGHDLGVIKSEDGGTTWMRSDDGMKGADIHGLAINQRNPNVLFAYSVENGVFRSEDAGVSWKRMDDGPENPGVRAFAYMAVQTSMDKSMGWDNWGLLFAGTADGLYQSFSCFCGWTKTTETFDNTTLYSLATLQADLEVMYAGTKDGLWKTPDAGKTWERLAGAGGVKITAIALNPKDHKEIVAASETGAVFQSRDAGKTWERTNQ